MILSSSKHLGLSQVVRIFAHTNKILIRSIEAIKSDDSIPNLRSLVADKKKIFGVIVTVSYNNDLIDAAKAKSILLFIADGTGFFECTNSTVVLPVN